MKKWMWVVLAAALILAGCDLFNRDFYRVAEEFPETRVGSLIMALDGSEIATSKTIAPTNMTVSTYDLTFTHTSPTPVYSFPVSGWSGSTFTRTGLEVGNWTVTVVAKDSSHFVIGAINGVATDVKTFSIVAGQTTNAGTANIIPITGTNGRLNLTVTWADGALATPVTMTAYLVPPGATGEYTTYPISPAFTVDTVNRIATYPLTNKAAGYYRLHILLFGNAVQAWGWTDSVRIVDGKDTTGTLNFAGTGGLSMPIVYDPQNPLPIDWSNPSTPPVSIPQGGSITITAVPTPSTAPTGFSYEYQWYISGVPITGQTSATLSTYGSSLTPKNYSLCVVLTERVISTNAIRTISSKGFNFSVYVP